MEKLNELKKSDIKFILSCKILCKDFNFIYNEDKTKVFLNDSDFKTLKVLKNLSKGY